jgi:hypothetical protein
MFVLRRTDQGGGYVAKAGNSGSYTNEVKRMKKYPTEEAAKADACPENEMPVPLSHLID